MKRAMKIYLNFANNKTINLQDLPIIAFVGNTIDVDFDVLKEIYTDNFWNHYSWF